MKNVKLTSSLLIRDASGRYVCHLPFSGNPAQLGDSTTLAKRLFNTLERKFESQPEFKQKYVNFMNDYLACGHMKLCTSVPSLNKPHYFLPHHGVFKDRKIRVVFNASAPSSSGVSLNHILHQGPKLHNDITDIILRFRQHKFVFSCDIKQMFRQISIHEDDQIFQLIYWREDTSVPLKVYQLTTVTYGMTSSPYLANRVVQQLIMDEGKNHPLAAEALQQQIYVDDALLGSNSLEEALHLQEDVVLLLKKGGFELSKWSSNHPKLLENVMQDNHETPLMLRTSEQPFSSVLGLKWISDIDVFSYLMHTPSSNYTKRTLLSSIAQMYDPCGWISPIVFWSKVLMQHVWTLGLD